MIYNIKWLEKKSNDWIVATLVEAATQTGIPPNELKDVSINRVNKKGEVFPKFDEITNGGTVEGEPWASQAGKWYLFAPKPQSTRGGAPSAFKGKQIEEAQARKAESIEKFQSSKEESIALMAAQRDAVLIVTATMKNIAEGEVYREDYLKSEIIKWRNWFLSDDFKAPPF